MSEHNGAKSHYLQAALAESFRIIERDHGAEYVDRLVDAIFRTFNVQDAVLEHTDLLPPPNDDHAGREVIEKVLTRARGVRDTLI